MLLKKIKHVLLAITGGLIIFSAGAQAKNDKTAIGAIYLDTQGYYAGSAGACKTAPPRTKGKLKS